MKHQKHPQTLKTSVKQQFGEYKQLLKSGSIQVQEIPHKKMKKHRKTKTRRWRHYNYEEIEKLDNGRCKTSKV